MCVFKGISNDCTTVTKGKLYFSFVCLHFIVYLLHFSNVLWEYLFAYTVQFAIATHYSTLQLICGDCQSCEGLLVMTLGQE